MSENFSEKLSQVKTPKVNTPEHKRKLKNALLNRVYLNKDKSLQGFGLFNYLRNMSLKKLIPAGLVAIFVFTIVSQNFLAWRNTAYAQELINETISKIESEPLTEEENEVMESIKILEEMKKEGELKYLGEKPYPPETEYGPERKVKEFSVTDEDFSNDLIINILDNKEISLMIDAPLQKRMSEDLVIKADEAGEILNMKELKEKLKLPRSIKPWLKEIINISNKDLIELMEQPPQFEENEEYENYLKSLSPEERTVADKERENSEKCSQIQEKITKQIKNLVKDTGFLLNGGGGGCGDNPEYFTFRISIFSVIGEKNRTNEAQIEIQKIIDIPLINHFSVSTGSFN